MIIKGSLNYDRHGRKIKRKTKKTDSSSRSRTPPFHGGNTGSNPVSVSKQSKTSKIPSAPIGKYKPPVDNSWKVEASKQYTVAPAYNKGAYQVIPKGDIKHIGK